MNEITIVNSLLPIREYNGQRVITFKDIDTVHQRPAGTARKRFNDNKKHFVEGEDYFVRKTDEAYKEFGITAPNGLVLITESGYLMVVKSFTDDLSWDVQRQLVNNYFRSKELEALERRVQQLESRIESGTNRAIPQIRDTSRDQANADYLLDRLLKQPKTELRKYDILRMCRRLKAADISAAITILCNADIVRYTVIRRPKGRPIEMIELIK